MFTSSGPSRETDKPELDFTHAKWSARPLTTLCAKLVVLMLYLYLTLRADE